MLRIFQNSSHIQTFIQQVLPKDPGVTMGLKTEPALMEFIFSIRGDGQ